jgi:4-hydroxy-4-methyl-2-oxoglutarate aldolase
MDGHRVVRDVPRGDPAAIERLREYGVATVYEALGRLGLLQPVLRPICEGMAIAGSAVTVSCPPGDNLMIHLSLLCCRPGDVLVVAVTSESTDGMVGELLATSMRAHGVAGLVIDAGVRDVAELRSMRFPVWARAISARGTTKASPGSVNIPVVCAGAAVHPGDVIVADDDGVLCVPQSRVDDAVSRAEERAGREDKTREQLAAGVLGADIYGLRGRAVELGIDFVDRGP